MATSTEATVRTVIVNAIRAIAQSDLGFDEPNGNIREYPLEFHQNEQRTSYLMAKVNGVQTARAWAVDVIGYDEPFALGGISKRTYQIRILAYYGKGVDGVAYHAMIDHARKIREAMNGLTNNIGGTANLISSATGLVPGEQIDSDVGRLITGTMTYAATRTNPDY
jgi:hypothetical protein